MAINFSDLGGGASDQTEVVFRRTIEGGTPEACSIPVGRYSVKKYSSSDVNSGASFIAKMNSSSSSKTQIFLNDKNEFVYEVFEEIESVEVLENTFELGSKNTTTGDGAWANTNVNIWNYVPVADGFIYYWNRSTDFTEFVPASTIRAGINPDPTDIAPNGTILETGANEIVDVAVNETGQVVYAVGTNSLRIGDFATSISVSNVTGASGAANQIAYGNGVFIYAGNGGIARSTDNGATWTEVVNDTTSNNFTHCAYLNGSFFAYFNSKSIGFGQRSVWRSDDDGLNWYTIPTRISPALHAAINPTSDLEEFFPPAAFISGGTKQSGSTGSIWVMHTATSGTYPAYAYTYDGSYWDLLDVQTGDGTQGYNDTINGTISCNPRTGFLAVIQVPNLRFTYISITQDGKSWSIYGGNAGGSDLDTDPNATATTTTAGLARVSLGDDLLVHFTHDDSGNDVTASSNDYSILHGENNQFIEFKKLNEV